VASYIWCGETSFSFSEKLLPHTLTPVEPTGPGRGGAARSKPWRTC